MDEELPLEEEQAQAPIPLTDEEVLAIVKADYETAKENKTEIDGKIQDWKNLYDGAPLGNETDGRSKYVAKESQKAVNWWIPNAMKPFMSTEDMADFSPRTFDDVENAKSQNTLINYQFNNDFPKYQFLHTALQLYATEGTVVARTGWIHKEETETMPFEGITQEQLMQIQQSGAEIQIEDQAEIQSSVMNNPMGGTHAVFKGQAIVTKTTVSRPDVEVIKNEDFFIIGETIADADCCIQRIDTNRSELREKDQAYSPQGIYQNVDEIQANGKDTQESSLGQDRINVLDGYGQDDDATLTGKGREDITIYEYYGKIDRNNDGIAEPIVCVWSGNTILRIADNPFPDEEPPFISAPYMPVAFSFWGNGMPFYLEDNTKVKSAIMRTFIDLMASSTNGINHVQKGAIDALNSRKLREAKIGSVIEWNDLGGLKDQVKNDIPSSLQQMYELFTSESENESGVTRYSQGLDSDSLNKTATGITAIMNQSQMRTWETVTRFAEQFLKPLFRKWVAYNQVFLDDNIAVRVVGGDYTSVSKDDIKGNFDLKVSIALSGTSDAKAQKIIQMLQMTQPLVQAGVLPVGHITKLIAELEELWEFKELAQELKQQVNMQEQAQMQGANPQQGVAPQQPNGQPQQ